jgi:hypothetical protein
MDEHWICGCCRPERGFEERHFEGISNVSCFACIAAGVPSAIKMRSMQCPHRVFRRHYGVMEGTCKIGDLFAGSDAGGRSAHAPAEQGGIGFRLGR